MNIPEKVYHGFYNKIDSKYKDMDENSKWREARKMIVTVLEAELEK